MAHKSVPLAYRIVRSIEVDTLMVSHHLFLGERVGAGEDLDYYFFFIKHIMLVISLYLVSVFIFLF